MASRNQKLIPPMIATILLVAIVGCASKSDAPPIAESSPAIEPTATIEAPTESEPPSVAPPKIPPAEPFTLGSVAALDGEYSSVIVAGRPLLMVEYGTLDRAKIITDADDLAAFCDYLAAIELVPYKELEPLFGGGGMTMYFCDEDDRVARIAFSGGYVYVYDSPDAGAEFEKFVIVEERQGSTDAELALMLEALPYPDRQWEAKTQDFYDPPIDLEGVKIAEITLTSTASGESRCITGSEEISELCFFFHSFFYREYGSLYERSEVAPLENVLTFRTNSGVALTVAIGSDEVEVTPPGGGAARYDVEFKRPGGVYPPRGNTVLDVQIRQLWAQ